MIPPKITKAGQSKSPLRIHTVTNPQGKKYSYRGRWINVWLTERELNVVEEVYNYIKSTKHQDFTDKERSTLTKFAKAVWMKYSKMIKRKYVG